MLNINSTLIFFMIETYSFSSKKIIDIIGKQFLLKNKNDIYITSIEWICHDMFLIIYNLLIWSYLSYKIIMIDLNSVLLWYLSCFDFNHLFQ